MAILTIWPPWKRTPASSIGSPAGTNEPWPLKIYQALGDEVQAARKGVNKANVLENLDQFREAMEILKRVRPVFAEHGKGLTVARTDLNLAILSFRQGRYREALEVYDRARSGFAALGNEGSTRIRGVNALA